MPLDRKIKIVATGCATLALALAAGHIMQKQAGLQEPAPQMPAERAFAVQDSQDAVELTGITLTSAVPSAPAEAMAPVDLPTPQVQLAALDVVPAPDLPAEEPAPAFACDYGLTATAAAAAMVTLEVSVPCMPNERFTLHHNGMMFTDATDATGARTLSVPALSEKPVFILAFANGEGAVASTEVTSFDYYDRVVVQWKGQSGLQLHALEYQADYDSEGHVWHGAERDPSAAATGTGGFMTRLGAEKMGEAQIAEIYTFPTGLAPRDGEVALSLEAEVTAANCGRDIDAQSIQISVGNTPRVQDLTLAMPDCNAAGDFLVLKNLLNDLKIARN